jgi:hypothetical protein
MPWKKDSNNAFVTDENGNPIFLDLDKENPVNYEAMRSSLTKANGEAMKHREELAGYKKKFQALDGVDDVAAFLKEKTDMAEEIARLKKNTDVNLIEEKVKEATAALDAAYVTEKKLYESQISQLKNEIKTSEEKSATLKADFDREKIRGFFNDSQWLKEKGALSPSVYFDLFHPYCSINEDGEFVGGLYKDKSTPLVDMERKPRSFEAWINQIIQDYPGGKALIKGSSTSNPGSGANNGLGTGTGGNNPFAKDTWNLTEQHNMFTADQTLARSMAAAAGITI